MSSALSNDLHKVDGSNHLQVALMSWAGNPQLHCLAQAVDKQRMYSLGRYRVMQHLTDKTKDFARRVAEMSGLGDETYGSEGGKGSILFFHIFSSCQLFVVFSG